MQVRFLRDSKIFLVRKRGWVVSDGLRFCLRCGKKEGLGWSDEWFAGRRFCVDCFDLIKDREKQFWRDLDTCEECYAKGD
jgi:hypothetical protein